MIRLIIKIACTLDSFLYKLISHLAIIENGGLHPKHKILNYHQFFVDNIGDKDSVLDIGSGNGAMAFDVAVKAKKVVGIDIVHRNVAFSRKKYHKDNIEFIEGDATTFNFQETFDAITLSNVLEHIENRIDFLKDIKRLAPKILIRVPLITRDWVSVWKKEQGWSYKLDDTHFIEYTEENFVEEMRAANLKIDSFYIKFGELYAVVSEAQPPLFLS